MEDRTVDYRLFIRLGILLLWVWGTAACSTLAEVETPFFANENEDEALVAALEDNQPPLPSWATGLFTRTLMHDGREREYILYIPESSRVREEVPLVLNFHGFTGTAESQLNYADFRSIADEAGFILVYPEGTLLNEQDTHWNVGGWTVGSQVDDVAFTALLINSLVLEYNIDFTRIYATGHSNGGYMSFLLACQLGDKIAAVASMSGSMTPETFADCQPTHPTPVLQFHGTADRVVPYNGTSWSKSIEDVLAYWVSYNQLDEIPSVVEIERHPDTTADSTIEHIRFGDESAGVVVEHMRVVDGGHEWLGNSNEAGKFNVDLVANEEIWAFFSRYDLYGRVAEPPTDPG